MKEVSYTLVSVVLGTWDHARFSNKNFEKDFGTFALERMKQLVPEEDTRHLTSYISSFAPLVDSVIQLLGPDIDFVRSILSGIGKSFRRMGGRKKYLVHIGDAMLYSLEKNLGRDLTREERYAFDEVYNVVSEEISMSFVVSV